MLVRIRPHFGEETAVLGQQVGREQTFMTTYGLMNSWRAGGFRPEARSYNAFNDGFPAISQGPRAMSRADSVMQSLPTHLQLQRSTTMGADDMRTAYQRFQNKGMNPTFPLFGTPRMRYGRAGGSWRHVREVTQAAGPNTVFVDGIPKVDDNSKIVYRDADYANVIQPKATCKVPIKTMADEPSRPRRQSPVYNSVYGTDTGRGLEKDNWMIVR